jgi:hypothetical protein
MSKNTTDTNQASELFELCKEVYERTKWGQYGDEGLSYFNEELNVARKDMPPLYTSDYLLEKLPQPLTLRKKSYSFEASIRKGNRVYPYADADTPLKALLKLTIALSEAGELK